MGYRVHYLERNQMVHEDYEDADRIRVVQNHLHIFQDDDCLAIYQSGWWIKTRKIEEE